MKRQFHPGQWARSLMLAAGAALLFGAGMLGAGRAAAATPSAEEIMKESHLAQYYAGDSGRANVEMKIVNKRGKERRREFVIVRKDMEEGGDQRFYIYFKAPGDVRRMSFLAWKNPHGEDARWIYVPAIDLVRQISARDKFSAFAGSDFTYEDVSGRHWLEDTHTLKGEETINDKSAYVLESVPAKGRKSSYTRRVTWVDKETKLPIKSEYYGKGDKLERVFEVTGTADVAGHMTVTSQTMANIKKKSKTTVEFKDIEYDVSVDDAVFTEDRLRTPPRDLIGG
jgi:outer membrane lipoprotein-sorting protein